MTKFRQNVQSQKKPFVSLKIFGAQHLRNLSAGKSKTCCLRVRESEREREKAFCALDRPSDVTQLRAASTTMASEGISDERNMSM